MDKLLPCPFCGGEVAIALIDNTETQQEWFITRGVGGNRCKCRLFMESHYFQDFDEEEKKKRKEELVSAWNKRIDK